MITHNHTIFPISLIVFWYANVISLGKVESGLCKRKPASSQPGNQQSPLDQSLICLIPPDPREEIFNYTSNINVFFPTSVAILTISHHYLDW